MLLSKISASHVETIKPTMVDARLVIGTNYSRKVQVNWKVRDKFDILLFTALSFISPSQSILNEIIKQSIQVHLIYFLKTRVITKHKLVHTSIFSIVMQMYMLMAIIFGKVTMYTVHMHMCI